MIKKEYGTRKKYHFIYKTVNLLSGRYYIGMHSTDNLNDGYLGSGTLLRRSINKYGKKNHSIEILEFLNSREELAARESEIVSLQEIAKKECMNLKVGGRGGFAYEVSLKASLLAKKATEEKRKDPEYVRKMLEMKIRCNQDPQKIAKLKKSLAERYRNHPGTFTGKKHREDTKRKIGAANSARQKGELNSQYGTCWITNTLENKKINIGDAVPEGWRLGRCIKR